MKNSPPILKAVSASVLIVASGCSGLAKTAAPTAQSFGQLPDGRAAHLYSLKSPSGFQVDIADYGGTVVRILAPDRDGHLADVVLGFDSVEPYPLQSPYFGALIGRVGNRIAAGKFNLNGTTYTLATNNDPGDIPCHLHGGTTGFDKVMWQAEPAAIDGLPALRLRYVSADGEEGYPGELTVEVLYSITADDGLRIEYVATTTRPTPVNLTNHTYFNLAGAGRGSILAHELEIKGRRYTPVDVGLIPTGEIASVAETPFDFTVARPIGARIAAADEQLEYGGGYDHNFVLDAADGSLALAAVVYEPSSGRRLDVLTTEPGLQFYSGNFLDGTITGKSGRIYDHRGAFCLEAQHFPDSINQPGFPNTVLQPGETYRSTTEYRFSAQ